MIGSQQKAVVYMRVSTSGQDVENQRASCMQVCERHGWEVLVIDETASGARVRRPGWDRVLSHALSGEIVAVVVWALDRIGRSMDEIFRTVSALDTAGVRVVSVREPWLDSQAGGDPLMRRLMLAMFGWAAEFERERLLQRSREGTDRARKEGRIGGRPPKALLGDDLAFAVRLHQAGQTLGQIQKALLERAKEAAADARRRGVPLAEIKRAKPLPRATIHSAITRLVLFDGARLPKAS